MGPTQMFILILIHVWYLCVLEIEAYQNVTAERDA